MIITAKSTRQDAGEPAASQPYRFVEEPRSSRWPWAFAALLGGVTLYIRSMVPGWGEAEAGAQRAPDPREDGAPPVPRGVARGLAQEGREAAGHAAGGEQAAADSAAQSGDGLVAPQRHGAFESILSPELLLADYGSFVPAGSGMFALAGTFTVANDNALAGGIDAGMRKAADSGKAGSQPDAPDDDGDDDGPDEGEPDEGEPDDGEPDADDPDDEPDAEEPDDEPEAEEPGGAGQERINRAPRVNGPVSLADAGACSIVLIGLSDLLARAADPDGDTLSVLDVTASSGTLTQAGGGWLFEADGYGPVTITYQISDGALAVAQAATFDVVRNSVAGTSGDDLLVGAECGDDIEAGDGDDGIDARGGGDTVLAGAGGDTVLAGAGDDHVLAGAGADTVHAGPGDDLVLGGDGNDWISGGEGNDRLFGEAGDDTLFGDDGHDHVSGGEGQDLVFGGEGDDDLFGDEGHDRIAGGGGDDALSGGEGDDVLMGEAGDDRLAGNAGSDTLSGGEGRDVVDAGAGDDTVLGDLDAAADSYDGGAGLDTLSYAAARETITIHLLDAVAEGAEIGTDAIASFERVVAGAGDDALSGSHGADHLVGNQGDDRIAGGAGDDVVEGGEGDDTLSGGEGRDHVLAGAGDDTVAGDLDAADDSYDGGAGLDTIDYSAASASVSFDLASGRITGVELGEDTISSFEVFVGGGGDDHFIAGGHAAVFQGGGGDDLFEFGPPFGPPSGPPSGPQSGPPSGPLAGTAGQRVAYEILDFMAGDRIKVSQYEIFEEVMDSLEHRFEEVYGDGIDQEDMPILISHQHTGDVRRTLIEADLDHDDYYELAITITGNIEVTISEIV